MDRRGGIIRDVLARDWTLEGPMHPKAVASVVPAALTGMLESDPAHAASSIDTLMDAIWHQGTVYPVTALALDFVARLLVTRPSVEVRWRLADVLCTCALSASDWHSNPRDY